MLHTLLFFNHYKHVQLFSYLSYKLKDNMDGYYRIITSLD